jgi:hypothetical protein
MAKRIKLYIAFEEKTFSITWIPMKFRRTFRENSVTFQQIFLDLNTQLID